MITEDQLVSVTPTEWVTTCAEFAVAGLDVVDWLTAVDRIEELEVVVLLVKPGASECVLVSCRIDARAPRIASLADLFPGAEWHERETAEMFGIEFVGRKTTEPLLLRAGAPGILRKATPLTERVETPWPGADVESGRRRRKPPPGVRPEWENSDG